MKKENFMKARMNRRQFIKSSAQAAILLGLSGESYLHGSTIFGQGFDLIIKNGTVIDGIKAKGYKADLGIVGERISVVGNLQDEKGRTIIDATGRAVCPGFIDIHSHTDFELLINPKAESKIRQGVTTELSGNCGESVFPRKKAPPEAERIVYERLEREADWVDLEGYRRKLSQKGIAVNHGTLAGQGTIRNHVMGEEKREPTPKEMELMKKCAAEAMEQGAFGVSTGLEYAPSGFASASEVIKLCKVAAKYGGFYATHVRSEDNQVLEAVGESLFIAEEAEIPLQISHLKASGRINWWKMPMIIDLIERARERGIRVTADRYPYTAYSTGLSIFFPQWALDGGAKEFVKRLKNRDLREKMKTETLENIIANNSWESLLLVEVNTKKNRHLEGKYSHEAAAKSKKDPYEFACDLLIEEGGDVSIVGFGMSEENTETVLKHPLVMLCSDGVALAPYGPLNRGVPHPRNYGAFPRFLRLYVRDKRLLSLPEAIKKMTSLPAAKMKLRDRGSIKKGNFADLVIFDPGIISDKATYTEPKQYPRGIDYVIVNGRTVIDHDKHTGELPGKVLDGPGKK
jgi:N-acyl-D-amino-acid deacylase